MVAVVARWRSWVAGGRDPGRWQARARAAAHDDAESVGTARRPSSCLLGRSKAAATKRTARRGLHRNRGMLGDGPRDGQEVALQVWSLTSRTAARAAERTMRTMRVVRSMSLHMGGPGHVRSSRVIISRIGSVEPADRPRTSERHGPLSRPSSWMHAFENASSKA